MPKAPVVVRKKKPVAVVKKESPPVPAKKKQPPKQASKAEKTKVEKPKGPAPVDKVQQHKEFLAELDAMSSPERDIARVCYFLCFLVNENEGTTTLFPLKDKVLKKLYDSEHNSLMVSYVRRGIRANFTVNGCTRVANCPFVAYAFSVVLAGHERNFSSSSDET